VVDVSIDNPNVFYEFGLAYGLKHKLFIVHDIDSASVEDLKSRFLPEDITSKMYAYPNLKPIPTDEGYSHRFYCPDDTTLPQAPRLADPRIVILDLGATENPTSESKDDISLSFLDVINGAIGVSLDNIVESLEDEKAIAHIPGLYLDLIRKMKSETKEFGPSQDAPFENIRSAIDNAYCVMIKTTKANPFAYFWLGYCHAKGKNVIPICELDAKKGDKDVKIDDLAFDIRSLWHLELYKESPTEILQELQEILQQMILTDFVEWSRKPFWSRIFGTLGRVSIFTGSLHNPDFKREMVGDWDLRTASELMSYFSTHQLISTIESPIYQPEKVEVARSQYLKQIGRLLRNKNAIVIASPDVNPLTEFLLGRLYDVPSDKLFPDETEATNHKSSGNEEYPRAVIAIKKRSNSENQSAGKEAKAEQIFRFFLADEPLKQKDQPGEERGFRANWLPKKELLEEYLGQKHLITDNFNLYAHLVIAFNPFDDKADYGSHYVVILNGVSGPSTFALTQLLTGGIGKEFVDYSEPIKDKANEDTLTFFNPNNESESILKQITEQLDKYVNKDSDFIGVQMIVKVTVGLPHKRADDQGWTAFDRRRVKGWELEPGTLKLIERSKAYPITNEKITK
jgi:hypothetical protein